MSSQQHECVTGLSRREAMERMAAALAVPSVFRTSGIAGTGQRPAQSVAPVKRTVQTVTGAIDAAKLGFTLSHEHVCAGSAGLSQAWPELFGGRSQFIKTAVDQLKQAKDEGVDSLIDVTTVDLGRDIRLLEEVARKSGLQIFESEGLSPAKVCIGHTDNSAAEYQMGLSKRGYYLGMDQLPRGGPAPPGTPLQQAGALAWEQRYLQIKALVDAGFANRILLGNDHSIAMSLQPTASDRLRLAQNPDGILFVSRKAIPALRTIGVSEQAIRTMAVEAPRRFLEG
ncbi:MAG TPA: hypothetical protein VIK60_14720 [Vicinamibacterales bacterium]